MKVISVINRKGGVAKTSTVQAIASYLRSKKKKVLLIDMDSQGNLSMFNGAYKKGVSETMKLLRGEDFKIVNDVIASNFGLSAFEKDPTVDGAVLKNCIAKIAVLYKNYDYIIIDTSPGLGLLTVNGLIASEYVVIPSQADEGAFLGAEQTLDIIASYNKEFGQNIKIAGIVITCYNPRLVLHQRYMTMYKGLAKQYNTTLFENYIPKGVSIQEAQALKEDLLKYGGGSKPAKAYKAFCDELMKVIGE